MSQSKFEQKFFFPVFFISKLLKSSVLRLLPYHCYCKKCYKILFTFSQQHKINNLGNFSIYGLRTRFPPRVTNLRVPNSTLFFHNWVCGTFLLMSSGLDCNLKKLFKRSALRKQYPYSQLFWSVFPHFRTEYGEIRSISSYLVRMRENMDQDNSEYGHFLCKVDFTFKSETRDYHQLILLY